MVYAPKPGSVATPYGNPIGGVQQMYPSPPNGTGYNPAPYPSSHQLTDVSQPQGYPYPAQPYVPTASQGLNPPIQYPESGNNIASNRHMGQTIKILFVLQIILKLQHRKTNFNLNTIHIFMINQILLKQK